MTNTSSADKNPEGHPVHTGILNASNAASSIPLLAGYIPHEEIVVLLITETTAADALPDGAVVPDNMNIIAGTVGNLYRVALTAENTEDPGDTTDGPAVRSVFNVTADLADITALIAATVTRDGDTHGTRFGLLVATVSEALSGDALLKIVDRFLIAPLRQLDTGAVTVVSTDSYTTTPTTATMTADHGPGTPLIALTDVPVVHWTNTPTAAEMIWQGIPAVHPDFTTFLAARETDQETDDTTD